MMFGAAFLVISCYVLIEIGDCSVIRDQCAAWTGYYGPKGTLSIAELIICPENLYGDIGIQLAKTIKDEICSFGSQTNVANGNYVNEILNISGFFINDTIDKICTMQGIDNVTLKSLPSIIPQSIGPSKLFWPYIFKYQQLR